MTKFLTFAAVALLITSPAMAEDLSIDSMSSEVNVTTPDITSRGVPAAIAIQPNRTVTRTTTTTYTNEEPVVNTYRGYHGRDIIFSQDAAGPISTTSSSTTIVSTHDPLMEDSRIPGVMSLEDEANLAISAPSDFQ